MKKTLVSALTFAFLTFTASALDYTSVTSALSDIFSSAADDNEGITSFRSLNIPAGGRAEALGSAYTGLCDDISFFDYNPAASCVLQNTELAFFHNSWIADSAEETLAGTTRFGNFGLGLQLKCFYVPFTEYNLYGDRVAGSYYSETSATINASYNFMAGYNFKGLAVGINGRTSYRSVPDYTDNQTDEIISGSGLSQSAVAFMGDIGILLRFNMAKFYSGREPNLRLGISMNNIGAALTGFGDSIEVDDPLPAKVSAGVSYRPFSFLLFTLDFKQPVNLQSPSQLPLFSLASGVEISITNFFSFESGLLIQGGNPRLSFGSQVDIKGAKVNVNYTFDLTSSSNPINHISVSAKLNLGDRGRAEKQKLIDAYYQKGLEYYAQGTRESLESAIEQWDLALNLDKRFDPAIEGKTAALDLIRWHELIRDFGTLDKKKQD